MIRPAHSVDADQIAAIYRPFVTETTVSFEEVPPDPDEMRRRIGAAHLWLVDVDGDQVRGYAYGTVHRSRHAYRFTTETSIYLPAAMHGSGVARPLYDALLGQLSTMGFVTAVAGITLPNDSSVGFHRALGFAEIGVFPKVGFKFERWHDTIWMSRPL